MRFLPRSLSARIVNPKSSSSSKRTRGLGSQLSVRSLDTGSLHSTMTVPEDKPLLSCGSSTKDEELSQQSQTPSSSLSSSSSSPPSMMKRVRFNMGATKQHHCPHYDRREDATKAIQALWYTAAEYKTFKGDATNTARDVRDAAILGTWQNKAPAVLVLQKALETWTVNPEGTLRDMCPAERKALVVDLATEIMQSGYLMSTDLDQDIPFVLGLERVGCTAWSAYRKHHREVLYKMVTNVQYKCHFETDRARWLAVRRASERITFASRALAMCMGQAVALTVVQEQA